MKHGAQELNYRKHLRLKEFDYKSPNYYFVTVCTDFRKKLFVPKISKKYSGNDVVRITNPREITPQRKESTDIVEKVLVDLEQYYNNLVIDYYVFMPDHLHFVAGFEGKVTRKETAITQPITNRHYRLGDIIKIFKKVCIKQLRSQGIAGNIFQPNYYEHIIRSGHSLEKIREYILNNPLAEDNKIPWSTLDPKPV